MNAARTSYAYYKLHLHPSINTQTNGIVMMMTSQQRDVTNCTIHWLLVQQWQWTE